MFSLALLVCRSHGGLLSHRFSASRLFSLVLSLACVAVVAGILELSPTAFYAHVAVFAGIFAVTITILFASGYCYFGA